MTQGMTLSDFQTQHEQLEYLQLQYLQKKQQLLQYQNYLTNQLTQSNQQHLKRSQSLQPSSVPSWRPSGLTNNSSIIRQQSTNTINRSEFSYPQGHMQLEPSLSLPTLPTPPCISLQRRDSVKSDSPTTPDSASSRYKTEMCRPFEETGNCRYGSKCQFAHGIQELRSLNRHPRYKTEFCRTFHTTGFCSYGQRCNFIHNEDERRSPKQSTGSAPLPSQSQQRLGSGSQAVLKSSTGSLGSSGSLMSSSSSSPTSSVYGDASASYMPDDLLSSRLSPTPSLSSDVSFPSPSGSSPPLLDDPFMEQTTTMTAPTASSPLDYCLSVSLLSSLNL